MIHSDPASISRWESGKQAIGHHTDLLLRAMVALDKKADDYPITLFGEIKGKKATQARYSFKRSADRWKPTVARAA